MFYEKIIHFDDEYTTRKAKFIPNFIAYAVKIAQKRNDNGLLTSNKTIFTDSAILSKSCSGRIYNVVQ
jgi:hypothetical protein